MKALLIAFVVVGAMVFGVIQFGGVMDFDPAAQASEFRAMAVPGAGWTALVEKAKPQVYMAVKADDEGWGDSLGMPIKYRPELFAENVSKGKFSDGFVLRWVFGAGDVIDLHFNAQGKLKDATEPVTTQDLLNGTAVEKMRDP